MTKGVHAIDHRLLDSDALDDEIARRSFWDFFLLVMPEVVPDLIAGWWQEDAAGHLQQFYEDLIAEKRPTLLMSSPPQHGKSILVTAFIAWVIGKRPSLRTIFASYSDDLGVRTSLDLQTIMGSKRYQRIFPGVVFQTETSSRDASKKARKGRPPERPKHRGYFHNTTVRGGITGHSMDLGVIDDPVKGRAEAESDAYRKHVWDWYTDSFKTRRSKTAGILLIMTRWGLDDLAGRIMAADPAVKSVRYQAIATEDEPHRKAGEALFPEHKPLKMLLEQRYGNPDDPQKPGMDPASWEALYQQNPTPRGGSIVKLAWLNATYKARGQDPIRVIQSWDTASKSGSGNARSACITLAQFRNRLEIWDVYAGLLEFPDLVKMVKTLHGTFNPTAVLIEDKDSGQGLAQTVKRETTIPVIPINPGQLNKVTRMEVETPILERNGVYLPESAHWLADFIHQVTTFPGLTLKDMVDALSQALRYVRENPPFSVGVGVFSVTKESTFRM